MLQAQSLSYRYGAGPVVFDQVDVSIKTGAITVLIGPSGTGKTTLLRCLAMLDTPCAGRLTLDDQSYDFSAPHSAPPMAPWPRVTAVFQQLFLWPHLTLRDNIMLPTRLQVKKGLRAAGEDQDELDHLIDAFDMGDFIDRYPNESSLGQRQRAAFVRALMLHPRYLLLDEITSALDVEQVAKVLAYLKILRDRGMGVFLITHLLGFARHTADHVVFMDGGRIVEQGPASLLENPQTDRLGRFLSVLAAAS